MNVVKGVTAPLTLLVAIVFACFVFEPVWSNLVRADLVESRIGSEAADEGMEREDYLRALDAADPTWRERVDATQPPSRSPADGKPIPPTFRGHLYFLGSDARGQDLLTRVLVGGRNSLLIGFFAAVITTLASFGIAVVAAYLGGWFDEIGCRILDVLWAFPVLLLGLALAFVMSDPASAVAHSTRDKVMATLVIAVVYVPYMARPVRAEVLTLREREFVLAARVHGATTIQVVRDELLPHLTRFALTLFPLFFANAIQLESVFSFLGVGVKSPEPSWGNVIADGKDWVVGPGAHVALVPGVFLFATTIALVRLADVVTARFGRADRRMP